MIGSGKRVDQLNHQEKAQLTADIAVVLFAHSGQMPQEACRKAEDFLDALSKKHLPVPSALPFTPLLTQEKGE